MKTTLQHARSVARRELVIALVLLLAGLLLLPAAVYMTGQLLFGPYEGGGGPGAFYRNLYAALGAGGLAAWLLVLSPLGVVTLARVAWGIFRARPRRGEEPAVAE
jgi:hypothetical protein